MRRGGDRRCWRRRLGSWPGFRGRGFRLLFGFGGGFGVRKIVEMLANRFGVIEIERARMRLLLRDANLGKILDERFGLDFELTRELVDSNLIHVRHVWVLFFRLGRVRRRALFGRIFLGRSCSALGRCIG